MEIKFRIWDKEVGCMIPMCDIPFDIECNMQEFLELILGGHSDRYIPMQYSGLKDKKRTKEYPEGQEIYVGDILKIKYWSNADKWEYRITEVEFLENSAKYMAINNKLCEAYEVEDMKLSEVIGNIHKNPELMKEINNG